MSHKVVLLFTEDDDDLRFRLRAPVLPGAIQDQTVVQVSTELALDHGVELDQHGFPTVASLEAWHRKNNPQLFVDDSE